MAGSEERTPGASSAKKHSAGSLIASWSGRRLRWQDVLLIFLPGSLAVLAPLIYGLQRAQYGYLHHGPAAAAAWSRPWFVLAAFALLPLLSLALYRLRLSRYAVHIHEKGLRICFSTERFIRWSEIAGVAAGEIQTRILALSLHTQQRVVLYPTLGRPVRLDGIADARALSEQIKTHIYPWLLPALQENFLKGQWLFFGKVAIHRSGLRLSRRRRPLPWGQVNHLAVQSGVLVVESKRPARYRIPVTDIINIELLLQIIEWGNQHFD